MPYDPTSFDGFRKQTIEPKLTILFRRFDATLPQPFQFLLFRNPLFPGFLQVSFCHRLPFSVFITHYRFVLFSKIESRNFCPQSSTTRLLNSPSSSADQLTSEGHQSGERR